MDCPGARDRLPAAQEHDALLVECVKAGQTEAFGKLVRKYQDRIFNTCWRLCGHLDDARDLTQEAFLKAFESIHGFRQESGFYTWLFRLAVNLTLSHRRSTKRRRTISLDQEPSGRQDQAGGLARQVEGTSPGGAEDAAGDAELHRRIAHALQRLDDEHRAVVVLRDIEGFDYRQIASILQIPPGTVKSRLHRARMTLREAVSASPKSDERGYDHHVEPGS